MVSEPDDILNLLRGRQEHTYPCLTTPILLVDWRRKEGMHSNGIEVFLPKYSRVSERKVKSYILNLYTREKVATPIDTGLWL